VRPSPYRGQTDRGTLALYVVLGTFLQMAAPDLRRSKHYVNFESLGRPLSRDHIQGTPPSATDTPETGMADPTRDCYDGARWRLWAEES
jgi:hypothetical protein